MSQLFKHVYPIGLGASILALLLFLNITNPEQIATGLLITPIVLLFLIIFCAIQIVFTITKMLKTQPRRRRTVALLSSALLTVVVILQSAGGISGTDLILLGLIIAVTGVYISKF